MSDKQKSLTKLIVIVLAILGGGAAGDAAGYTPDLGEIEGLAKGLGIGGATILVAYLHYVWWPVVRGMPAQLSENSSKLDRILQYTSSGKPVQGAPAEELPRAASGPVLAFVRPPESGRVRLDVILAFILCGVLAGGLFACGWLKSEAKLTATTAIDCATAKAKDAIKQFAPTVEQLITNTLDTAGRADWNTIESVTKDFAADVGGCVLASAVSRLLAPVLSPDAPASSPLELDRADLAHRWEQLRVLRYGGVQFKGAQ